MHTAVRAITAAPCPRSGLRLCVASGGKVDEAQKACRRRRRRRLVLVALQDRSKSLLVTWLMALIMLPDPDFSAASQSRKGILQAQRG